jgi:putative membrane protein insertion efficiency factor
MKTLLLLLVRGYQLGISPFLGQNCRFYPSCSHYALEAIGRHGAMRGGWLATKRLCKCHPWHPGGVDPVPEHSTTSTTACGCGHS